MREIKFRGFSLYFNEWIYGSLVQNWKYNKNGNINLEKIKYYIIQEAFRMNDYFDEVLDEVVPESVGQYIGLKDVDGTEIYSDDIIECVRMTDSNLECWGEDENGNTIAIPFLVKKDEYNLNWELPYDCKEDPEHCKIAGNIYENTDLLTNNN